MGKKKVKLIKTGKGYADWSICHIQDENGEYMNTVKCFKKEFTPTVKHLWKLFESDQESHMEIYKTCEELINILKFLKQDVGDYDMRT